MINPLFLMILIGICFFLSGSAALILEIVWTRYLNLIFGSTTLSISTTVAAFMGGLALGSFVSHRILRLNKDPLKLYGIFEIVIGLYALVIPSVLDLFISGQQLLLPDIYENAFIYSIIRFIFCFAVLILPTTAMGATLPVLSSFYIRNIRDGGKKMGLLYGINTAGATVGTFVAGFFLVKNLGVMRTNLSAALIDIFIGLLVIILSSSIKNKNLSEPKGESEKIDVEWILVVVGFFAGMVSMFYQILWTRSLSMVIGSSTYAFTIILTTSLLGITIGSLSYSRIISKRDDPVADLICIFIGIGLTALITSVYIDRLPFLVQRIMLIERFFPSHIFLGYFFVVAIVVIFPSVGMGMYMPLLIHIALRDIRTVTKDIGRIYSFNTIGNIIGSFLGGFIVIPFVGLETGLRISVLISVLIAFVLLFYFRRISYNKKSTISAILVVVLVLLSPRWDIARWSSGMFRAYLARGPYNKGDYLPPKVIFHKDGIVTTVTVEYREGGMYSLKVNGKVDASNGSDMSTQILSGLIPILFNPEAKKVAIIGFGSGTTSGTVVRTPVEEVVSIELEKAVIEASRHFSGFNLDPLSSPKHRLRIDDGRNYIFSTNRKFDVIISEPSNPWMSGASSLFTYDFWSKAGEKLREGGIFCQWLQMYELSLLNIKILMHTFHKVFPYVILFQSYQNSNDALLLGSFRPFKFNYNIAESLIGLPSLRDELEKINVTNPFDILILIYYTQREIEEFAVTEEINTDDNSIIEFSAPIDLLMYAIQKEDEPPPPLLKERVIDRIFEMMDDLGQYEKETIIRRIAESALKRGKLRSAKRCVSEIEDNEERERLTRIIEYMDGAEYAFPFNIVGQSVLRDRWGYFVQLLKQENVQSALNLINDRKASAIGRRIGTTPVEIYLPPTSSIEEELLMGYLYFYESSYYHAIYLWEKALKAGAEERYPWIYYYVGRAYYNLDEFADSYRAFRKFVEWDKENFLEENVGR